MKLSLRKIILSVLCIYCVGTIYTVYILILRNLWNGEEEYQISNKKLPEDDLKWNPWGLEFEDARGSEFKFPDVPTLKLKDDNGVKEPFQVHLKRDSKVKTYKKPHMQHIVEIWGKAAISYYLWEHIFNATLVSKMNGIWSFGEKQVKNVIFRFRTGPGVAPAKVPSNAENAILVLNGREASKIDFARMWLDYLPNLKYLKNVAVVLLGNEQCQNDWIKPYLLSNGGMVKMVFLVYDSPDVDDHTFFQWPLGVATYRGFPLIHPSSINVNTPRHYMCNFLGTVYQNSSRESLLRYLEGSTFVKDCYLKPRYEWQPQETQESLADFMETLRESDLTLSPVGMNAECYRIYEALSYGSVPVIENKITVGKCGEAKSSSKLHSISTPLRLLKAYGAPVIFISEWKELLPFLEREQTMTHYEKVFRRKQVLHWYEHFLKQMEEYFVKVVKIKFFDEGI